MTKPTLFTVPGTGGRTMRTLMGSSVGNYETMIGEGVDPWYWNWVDVEYPGDKLRLSSFVHMDRTEADGVDILCNLIAATPGKFAICGMSQGAAVVSSVYNEIRYGALTGRAGDFIAGIALGNPRRQTGFTIPGGTDPGVYRGVSATHGAYTSGLLTGCDQDVWWDFALPHDIATDIGDDSYGQAVAALFEFFYENYAGPQSFKDYITDQWGSGALAGLVGSLQDAISITEALSTLMLMGVDMLGALIAPQIINNPNFHSNGHFRYHFPYTNLPGNTALSAVDLAVAHLNDVASQYVAGPTDADLAKAIGDATTLAKIAQHPSTDIQCRIYDNTYQRIGEINDYISLQVSFPRHDVPTGTLVVKGSDPLVEQILKCEETVVPIVVEVGSLRWSGRVDVAHDKLKNGVEIVECELIHDKAWLTRIVAWPWWFEPLQAQVPSRGVAFGPAISVIKYIIASQVFRLQTGLWELVNNLGSGNLDWRSWFGTLLMQDPGDTFELSDLMTAVTTPIYVVPTNPLFDTSPFIAMNWRMDEMLQLVRQQCEDCGLTIDVTLWEPGMPQPDVLADQLNLLKVPTIVVDVKDRSGVTGFTGTFLDGIERTLIDLADSAFGEVLKPFLNPNYEYAPEGVNIAPLLGIHFVKPWCLFTDHPRGGLKEFDVAHHHPLCHTTITGGKSPQWMNDLIDATTSWLIDLAMIVVGFTGMSNVLEGAFSDLFFAFQQTENFGRRVKLGPYGFPEKFTPTGSGSYTLEAFFQQKAAQWDSRGYVAAQFSCDHGYPYELGKDVHPGALASVVRRGKLYTDYVENCVMTDDRDNRVKLEIHVGDGKAEDAPISKIQRRLVGIQENVNILLGATG